MPRKCPNVGCDKEHMTVKDLKDQLNMFPETDIVAIEMNFIVEESVPVIDAAGMVDYVIAVDKHCVMEQTIAISNFVCPSAKKSAN